MDFLSGLAKSAQSKPAAEEPSHADQPEKQHSNADQPEKQHSNADLFANAKVVAEAAQAQFGGEQEKCDKSKAAHAAADLLDAAEAYAKLDDSKGVGKYVEQAEGYLRKYDGAPAAGKEEAAPHSAAPAETPAHGGAGEKPAGDGGEKSEGGSGDLLKAAGSFFK